MLASPKFPDVFYKFMWILQIYTFYRLIFFTGLYFLQIDIFTKLYFLQIYIFTDVYFYQFR